MPLAHLIFFPEPRELTDAQYEEARAAGHLREPDAEPSEGDRVPVTEMTQQGIGTTRTGPAPAPPAPAPNSPAAPSAPGDKPKET